MKNHVCSHHNVRCTVCTMPLTVSATGSEVGHTDYSMCIVAISYFDQQLVVKIAIAAIDIQHYKSTHLHKLFVSAVQLL
jgi:hypothetical protein